MNWRRSQIDGVRKDVYITFRIGIALIPSSNQILIKTTKYALWDTRAKEIQIQDFVFTAYLRDM